MPVLELLQSNLLSPPVLAFALGALAVLLRSELALPAELHSGLSVYLLLAIGLKGGHELAVTPLADLAGPAFATLLLGVLIPVLSFATLKLTRRFGTADAAALAAHYGSVSAVTFAATLAFLDARGVRYEGFVPALVALLEVPAIVVAILLARLWQVREPALAVAGVRGGAAVVGCAPPRGGAALGALLHEVLTGPTVLLLLGGLAIGAASTGKSLEKVAPLFTSLFYGVLVLFLLDLGMVAMQRLRAAFAGSGTAGTRATLGALAAFAILMPPCNGLLGLVLGRAAGLGLGGAVVLAVMAASASYIAAPAAVRVALPEANPGYYLTAAIGITFPFNLAVGIPLLYEIAVRLYA